MSQDAGLHVPSPGVILRSALHGHDGTIDDLAWSPDGGFLATGSRDGTARLWRVVDGGEVAVLLPGGQGREVTSVAFSPDAELLATVAGDGTVRLWALPEATLVEIFRAPSPYYVRRVGWTRDGQKLVGPAGGTHWGRYFVWDRTSGGGDQPLTHPSVDTTPLPDELAARQPSWPRMWEGPGWPIRADGTPLVSMTGVPNVYTAARSPDRKTLAYELGGKIRLWDVADGRVLRTLSGHSGWVFGLAWSPDGMLLASKSIDGTVRLWDAARGHEIATIPDPYPPSVSEPQPGQHRPVFHPFRPDLLATVADAEQVVRIWQLDPALLPVGPRNRLRRLLRSS